MDRPHPRLSRCGDGGLVLNLCPVDRPHPRLSRCGDGGLVLNLCPVDRPHPDYQVVVMVVLF